MIFFIRIPRFLLCFLAISGIALGFVPLQSNIVLAPRQQSPREIAFFSTSSQPPPPEDFDPQQQLSPSQERSPSNLNSKTTNDDDATSTSSSIEEVEDDLMGRATFRLDGLEVYTVVSALTLSTSINFFDLLSHTWDWGRGFAAAGAPQWRILCDIVADGLGLTASTVGMITSLHCTLIFALMTVYGRTAVGRAWDNSFQDFFQATEKVRLQGFRSFSISLYSFLVQIMFLIVGKLPPVPWVRRTACAAVGYLIWTVYRDTSFIIDKAGSMLFTRSNMQK